MVFVTSSRFLPILGTFFCIGTEKVMYFLVLSPKQVNCFYDIMIIKDRSIVENYGNFFRYNILQITLNFVCYMQHFYVSLYNFYL